MREKSIRSGGDDGRHKFAASTRADRRPRRRGHPEPTLGGHGTNGSIPRWFQRFWAPCAAAAMRAVTIDGIARKVKRARTSIYRRWPSKRHLVAYAVLSEMGDNPAAEPEPCARTSKRRSRPCSMRSRGPWGRRSPDWSRTWRRTPSWRRPSGRKCSLHAVSRCERHSHGPGAPRDPPGSRLTSRSTFSPALLFPRTVRARAHHSHDARHRRLRAAHRRSRTRGWPASQISLTPPLRPGGRAGGQPGSQQSRPGARVGTAE